MARVWTPLLLAAFALSSCQKPGSVEPTSRDGAEPLAVGSEWADEGGAPGDRARAARIDTLSAWASDNIEGERYRVPVEPGDLVLGVADARVTFVVFNDYRCPYCAKFDRALRELIATYPTDVRVVIKQFPLAMHSRAKAAALAVLAAQRQGRGPQMHALVFDTRASLDEAVLRTLAGEAQVPDLRRFESDLEDPALAAQVERDLALGKQLGVRSTPSYFVNGMPKRGAVGLDELQAIYRAEVNAVAPLVDAGASRAEIYAALTARGPTSRELVERPSKPSSARPGKPDPNAHYAIPVDARPARGPDDALVTIAEFSDFECPYCRKVQPTLDELRKRYGDDVRVVYFHHPLPMHKHADDAALAALAAHRQGAFWPMHDRLFELAEQRALTSDVYEQLARELGLDVQRFRKDFADPTLAAELEADQDLAETFGASGTPNFFVNGRPLSGAQPVDAFVALIDEELAAAKAFKRKHKVDGDDLYAEMAKGWETEVEAPPIADHKRRSISTKDLPLRGKAKDPALEVVVCADFDCPYSARSVALFNELSADPRYSGELAYRFLHFPLPMHKDAEIAHRAAIAAGNQGKFWEMHDLLFADRDKRSVTELENLARSLGLDVARFRKDLDSQKTHDKLAADKATCTKLGVSGTPNFFVNGRSVRGAVPAEHFAELFDEELAGGFEAAPD